MIIPYIAAVMRDVFRANAGNDERVRLRYRLYYREVIWRIVLPFTKNGVIGGIMPGLGQRSGETMAVNFYHRQHLPARQRVAVYAGQQHHFRAGERIRRGGIGPHVAALMEL